MKWSLRSAESGVCSRSSASQTCRRTHLALWDFWGHQDCVWQLGFASRTVQNSTGTLGHRAVDYVISLRLAFEQGPSGRVACSPGGVPFDFCQGCHGSQLSWDGFWAKAWQGVKGWLGMGGSRWPTSREWNQARSESKKHKKRHYTWPSEIRLCKTHL